MDMFQSNCNVQGVGFAIKTRDVYIYIAIAFKSLIWGEILAIWGCIHSTGSDNQPERGLLYYKLLISELLHHP